MNFMIYMMIYLLFYWLFDNEKSFLNVQVKALVQASYYIVLVTYKQYDNFSNLFFISQIMCFSYRCCVI